MCMIQIYKCWHTKYAIMKEKHHKAIKKKSQTNMRMGRGMKGKNLFKKDKMNIKWNEGQDETDYYTNTTERVAVCQMKNSIL